MIDFVVFKRVVRNHWKMWLVYSAIAVGFLLLYIATFPTIRDQSESYNALVTSMPKGLREAFNISTQTTSLLGYISGRHFGLVWPLMAIMLMIATAGGAIAKEIETKTMGMLLSLPISRTRLYLVKVVSGLFALLVFVILSVISIWPFGAMFGYDVNVHQLINLSVLSFSFGVAVFGLGMLFSAIANEASRVYAMAGGVLIIMYAFNLVGSLVNNLNLLKDTSLFHYFNPGAAKAIATLDVKNILILSSFGIICAIIGLFIFRKKDVSV